MKPEKLISFKHALPGNSFRARALAEFEIERTRCSKRRMTATSINTAMYHQFRAEIRMPEPRTCRICEADRRLPLSFSTVKDRIFYLQLFYTPIRAIIPLLAHIDLLADSTTSQVIAFFARTSVYSAHKPGCSQIANP
jgi:hypothetical protein